MLRSISRDVPHQLSGLASTRSHLYRSHSVFSCRHPPRSSTSIFYSATFARHYSSLNPTPSPDTKRSEKVPPIQTPRKPKLELRPGPVKPKSSSPTIPKTTPNAPVTKKAGSQKAPTLGLHAAKEEALKDIKDAEQHGYLTPPPPGANWFKATLHKAIQLAKFYYRGVKLIFARRKEIADIRARVRAGGSPLTRAEFRMILTQKDDVTKVIPFLIIALLLEEIIPLIAIYAPFMLPSTCILPSQRERIEAKRVEKALNSSVTSKAIFAAIKAQATSDQVSLDAIKQVPGAPTAICSLLGLSTLGIDTLRIRRIRKHLEFIAEDDQLLIQDETQLAGKALADALADRGLILSGQSANSASSNEKLLQLWLYTVKDKTPQEALAVRLHFIISRQ